MSLLLALACLRSGGLEDPVGIGPIVEAAADATAPPGPFDNGEVALIVPDGWSAQPGPPGSGLVISLSYAPIGTVVEVWAFAGGGPVASPRPRPGCVRVFVDEVGQHRVLPGLGPTLAASCVSELPGGPVVQGWYAARAGREIHVEVSHPAGRTVAGREAAEGVLATIRWSNP